MKKAWMPGSFFLICMLVFAARGTAGILDYLQAGDIAQNEGRQEEAIEFYTKALASGTLSQEVASRTYNNRGYAYHLIGAYDLAVADFNEAVKLNPWFIAAYVNRAASYDKKGEFDLAVADADKVTRMKPFLADAYIIRGVIYENHGDHDTALADYNKAIKLNPRLAGAYFHRGNLYRTQGDPDSAIADYSVVIALSPGHVDAYILRGELYRDQGRYDPAIADFTRVLELDPKQTDTYSTLAVLHAKAKNIGQACSWLDQMLRKGLATREGLREDGSFADIRGEACFQELVAEDVTKEEPGQNEDGVDSE